MPALWKDGTSHTIPKRRPLSEHVNETTLLDKPWYKFTRMKYAIDLCENGRFLLSNLYYYRKDENQAAGVLDIKDGEFPYDVHGFNGTQCDPSGMPLNIFDNYRFLGSEFISDAFMFCASEFINDEVRDEFKDYDAIVKILEPVLFIQCVSQQLEKLNLVTGTRVANRCIYFEFPINVPLFLGDAYPAFVKHSKFSQQAEIRVLWEASHSPERVLIEDPLITRFCKIIGLDGVS
jgi:hypothetical protein